MTIIANSINNTGFIHVDKEFYICKIIESRGGVVSSGYKRINLLLRVIRKYHFKFRLPFQHMWYSKFDKRLEEKSTIIIFDAAFNDNFIKYISKKLTDKKIILWYWNPIRNSIDPSKLENYNVEKWSYSLEDCKVYNLKYNTTFYFQELVKFTDSDSNLSSDVCFIGRDKGRLNLLLKYKEKFESLELKTNFYITPTKWYELRKNKIYKKNIEYDQIIEIIKNSKAILDIVQSQSDGLTLRAMESIFFRKKLITNNKIIKKYDFYSKDNIFVLSEDNLDDLTKFIGSPYKNIPNYIVKKYEFQEWLNRFNK